jgi:hypothetical protein
MTNETERKEREEREKELSIEFCTFATKRRLDLIDSGQMPAALEVIYNRDLTAIAYLWDVFEHHSDATFHAYREVGVFANGQGRNSGPLTYLTNRTSDRRVSHDLHNECLAISRFKYNAVTGRAEVTVSTAGVNEEQKKFVFNLGRPGE